MCPTIHKFLNKSLNGWILFNIGPINTKLGLGQLRQWHQGQFTLTYDFHCSPITPPHNWLFCQVIFLSHCIQILVFCWEDNDTK